MRSCYLMFIEVRNRMLCLLLTAFFVQPCTSLNAQETDVKSGTFFPFFGVGIGFFHPGDVNDYIEASLPSNYVMEYGFTDLIMYVDLQGGVTFRMKQFDISGLLEYAIAPKYIMVSNGEDYSFFYHRISPGVAANYYIPMGTGRHAFLIGGGLNYSFMKFEEFSGSSPGFRLQAGVSLQFGSFNLQPYGAFSYAKAKDSQTLGDDFILDYTGGQIGVNLSFHSPVNHK